MPAFLRIAFGERAGPRELFAEEDIDLSVPDFD
jgi:hypothetical protein